MVEFDFAAHTDSIKQDMYMIYASIHTAIKIFKKNPIENSDTKRAFETIYSYAEHLYVKNGGSYGDFCFELIGRDLIQNEIKDCIVDTESKDALYSYV